MTSPPPFRPFSEPSGPLFADDARTEPTELPDERRPLTGRLAVVTGASGPLGAAIATSLAAVGAGVCLFGRDRLALASTRSAMPADARAPMLVCDLADGDEVETAAAFVARLGRPVDVVVHAAGLQMPSMVASTPVETLDEHYLLNIRGPYLLTQLMLPLMDRDRGRWVFFSAPPQGSSGDAHFSITRAAVGALAAQLRSEVAAAGLGVIEVETSDGDAGDGFVDALAATVVDAVLRSAIDVTELRVQPPSTAERRVER